MTSEPGVVREGVLEPSAVPDRSGTPFPAATHRAQPTLSVVVPTRNEAGNIDELVARLERAMPAVAFEIVFVDDSDDDTTSVIEAVQERSGCPIRLIHRPRGERTNGLGGAVHIGLLVAHAPFVCVMDADLQHPPELVASLLDRAMHHNTDLVVASRYSESGDALEFGRGRAALSHFSTTAARITFPRRLRGISDPLSGFFLVRKSALNLDQLRPNGFKILLEILVRTPNLRIAELGFHFGKRFAGESKASFREGMRYLMHLYRLRMNPQSLRFAKFLSVGLSGLLVNALVLLASTELLGLHYLLSAVIATQGSTLWNFALTEAWVFTDRRQAQGRLWRAILFLAMNNLAFVVRGPMIVLLTAGLGIYYVISNLISLIALTVVRYGLADNWIWKRIAHQTKHAGPFSYNIHDIVSITSDAWLPELERFLVQDEIQQPTMRVRLGSVKRARRAKRPAHTRVRHICYDEGLGSLGFGASIAIGDTIDVVASPILRRSPHVLYTNVVEPILRWTFVEKGYALVHAACIAKDGQAYFVTARTDTGKTTTMLRILARQRRMTDRVAFLSDDLVLVSRDGRVLTYPKPLTISHHTVRAINSAHLSSGERLVLPFQSRIHSRSGRRFAFLLTQTKLPVATINTIVQFLVPPPKYHVQRLVPNAKVAREAKLAGMFIIERGGDGDLELDAREAFETLLSNCEDAYGFPPYPTIKSFLYTSNGRDLREVEREIIGEALAERPTLLLRSTKMDWAQRIAAMLNSGDEREQLERVAPPQEYSIGQAPVRLGVT